MVPAMPPAQVTVLPSGTAAVTSADMAAGCITEVMDITGTTDFTGGT